MLKTYFNEAAGSRSPILFKKREYFTFQGFKVTFRKQFITTIAYYLKVVATVRNGNYSPQVTVD